MNIYFNCTLSIPRWQLHLWKLGFITPVSHGSHFACLYGSALLYVSTVLNSIRYWMTCVINIVLQFNQYWCHKVYAVECIEPSDENISPSVFILKFAELYLKYYCMTKRQVRKTDHEIYVENFPNLDIKMDVTEWASLLNENSMIMSYAMNIRCFRCFELPFLAQITYRQLNRQYFDWNYFRHILNVVDYA